MKAPWRYYPWEAEFWISAVVCGVLLGCVLGLFAHWLGA